jgi:hypothetical protein
MQTSGSSSSKAGTAGGAGLVGAVGLALLLAAGWMACSPGEPDCEALGEDLCNGGGAGGGGGGGGGGKGGTSAAPADCEPLGVASLSDFETKFIVPKCGQVMCHGPNSVFPPRNLDMPGMIRTNLVGKKATLACTTDFYINKTDVKKSFVLHKIESTEEKLPCPADPNGKADAGGTRMPNVTDPKPMPTIAGPRLSDGEIACFTWWVESVAKL